MEPLELQPLPSGARPPPPQNPQNPPKSSLNPTQILPLASDPFPPHADVATGGSSASAVMAAVVVVPPLRRAANNICRPSRLHQ